MNALQGTGSKPDDAQNNVTGGAWKGECEWRVPDVELIEDEERFAELEDEWNALYRDDPTAHIFLSHRWLADLHARREGVCVLAWRESPNAPLGAVWPLRRELVLDRKRRRFRGELMMAGNHWADYTGILCRPGSEARALEALSEGVLQLPWERLRIGSLRAAPDQLEAVLAELDPDVHRIRAVKLRDNDGATRLDLAPRIRLPGRYEDWLDTLGGNTRQKLRRHARRVANDPALCFRDSTSATRTKDLAAFRRLWLLRWGEAKGASATKKADKYVQILTDGLTAGQLRLSLLDAHGKPVAMAAIYDDPVHRTYAFYVGARDETFRTVPAGLLLHARSVEQAIDANYRVYDFLRGDEEYKYALGGVDAAALVNLDVRPRRPEPAHVLLDYCHRRAALRAMERAQGSARDDTIGRLYSQLLESWPGDTEVLRAYRRWCAGR